MALRRMTPSDWPRGLHALCTTPQMRVVLHRACLRADRTDAPLCAVTFHVNPGTARRLRRLGRLLLNRARVTDEIGWMSDRWLCAVLPETGEYGAYCFADAVRAIATGRGLDVSYDVYSHTPGDTGPHDPGSSESGRKRESIAAPSEYRASVAVATQHRHTPTTASDFLTRGLDKAAFPMRWLIKAPMPWWKRMTDVAGACIGLVVAAPIMVVAAAAIKLASPGAVIFQQLRAGLQGSRFTILKFRTMVPHAEHLKPELRALSEQDGPAFKIAADPRVTLVGRFLRVTSLDELPQFWNVLKGTMSLVGPRPLPVDEAEACKRWHQRRLDVVPGLTCIWQVRGRSRVSFDDWMRMDMEYIRRRSFLYDLRLLLLTVPAVILRRGAH